MTRLLLAWRRAAVSDSTCVLVRALHWLSVFSVSVAGAAFVLALLFYAHGGCVRYMLFP